jgi:hypothetical protein
MSRSTHSVVLAALLAGLGSHASMASAADEGRVIQMAIQAEPHMNAFEVQNNFTLARDSTQGFNFGEVRVDPIDSASFTLLSSIVRRGVLQTAPAADDQRGVTVEPLRGQDGAWWIDLRDPDKFLDSAKVTALDTKTQEKRDLTLEPAPRTETARELRYHSPGSYVLKLEKGLQPLAAVLTITTEGKTGGGSPPEDMRIGWPDVGRCYLVTLKGVTGDEQKLFDSLKDPNKVGNAIKEIYPQAATLIVGTYKYVDIDWRTNLVRMFYMVPVNARPRRLWLRFPLTEAEETAVRADLDAHLAPEDGFKKLPAWLAEHKLPEGKLLTPGGDAWLEIPVEPGSRTFDLTVPFEARAWRKALEQSPDRVGDRAVLVWEFQNPTNPADRSVIKVGGEWYQRQRFGWWLNGLSKAPLE